jgi:hypothetical protein
MMDQLIPFHRPNIKSEECEKMMNHLILQTKHTLNVHPFPVLVAARASSKLFHSFTQRKAKHCLQRISHVRNTPAQQDGYGGRAGGRRLPYK